MRHAKLSHQLEKHSNTIEMCITKKIRFNCKGTRPISTSVCSAHTCVTQEKFRVGEFDCLETSNFVMRETILYADHLFTASMRHCAEKPKTREQFEHKERILFADFERFHRKNLSTWKKKSLAENGKHLKAHIFTVAKAEQQSKETKILFRFIYLFRQCTCQLCT